MKFNPTSIHGVIIIEPDIYRDPRGFFVETYHTQKYKDAGIKEDFVQDNHSKSGQGTLRGLHLQLEQTQGKLVHVIEGEIFDVVFDCRRGSPTFKKWEGVNLSAENFKQIYAPPGVLHGFCVLSESAQVEYKCTNLYHPGSELSVLWNDPELKIVWPSKDPILSKKDAAGSRLADVLDRLPPFKG